MSHPVQRPAIGLLVLALLLQACGSSQVSDAGLRGELLVSAAASLTDAFADVEAAFEQDHPDVDVRLNLGGSSSLREQILAGAPADVFASADSANMDEVVAADLVATEPAVFATNRLQIAVPAGNPGEVTGLEDLADASLFVGLCAPDVPCGDLARQALASADVTPSLDTEELDVRALLTKIAARELDAGITYVTDVAAAGDRVEGIDVPDEHDMTAAYPIAVLADAPNPAAAAAFVAFVRSDQGQELLAAHGFDSP